MAPHARTGLAEDGSAGTGAGTGAGSGRGAGCWFAVGGGAAAGSAGMPLPGPKAGRGCGRLAGVRMPALAAHEPAVASGASSWPAAPAPPPVPVPAGPVLVSAVLASVPVPAPPAPPPAVSARVPASSAARLALSSAIRSSNGSAAPPTRARRAAVARSNGAARSGWSTRRDRASARMSSAACASAAMSLKPRIPAAPLIVWALRNSASMVSGGTFPVSAASRARVHVIEPLGGLVLEKLQEFGVGLGCHHAGTPSASSTAGRFSTPIRSPSSSIVPTSRADSASSARSASSPTSVTSSMARPAWRPSDSVTSSLAAGPVRRVPSSAARSMTGRILPRRFRTPRIWTGAPGTGVTSPSLATSSTFSTEIA